MWNAAAVGEFDFLDIALPRFPFLVDRQDDDGQVYSLTPYSNTSIWCGGLDITPLPVEFTIVGV